MAAIKTKSSATSSSTSWIHVSGTIQEVLDVLAAESVTSMNVPFWSDDATDAKALICRQA